MRPANTWLASVVRRRSSAFTRTELVAAVLTGLVLTGLLLPYLLPARKKHSELTCPLNLKQIGAAARMSVGDHAGLFPWNVSTNAGATLEFGAGGPSFRHFQALSNELSITRVLVCPQDTRDPAKGWNSMGNPNVSYFLGLDSRPNLPLSIISGDRNVTPTSSVTLTLSHSTGVKWVRSVGLHGDEGHVVFADGHVEKLNSAGLSNAIDRIDGGTNRLAVP